MKNSAVWISTFILILNSIALSVTINSSYSVSYDDLDPRMPGYRTEIKYRLQNDLGYCHSSCGKFPDKSKVQGFNRKLLDYIHNKKTRILAYRANNFRFYGGLRLKESWLGAVEGDSGFSNLQTSITLKGKAILKNKVELCQEITLFRADSTSYLDSASTIGEFLHDPLLSYQYSKRGPVASGVDIFEVQTDKAIIRTKLFGVNIQTGRDRVQFKGGYRAGLLFSGLTRPVDMFYRLDYNVWRFKFSVLSGQLTEAGKRYISAKRASLRLANNLQIGATEAVAFADDPTAYINPLMLYYIIHRHRPNNDDNLIAAMDISYTPIRNLNLYGEFLDDDLIVFEGGASKYGFLAGIYKSQLFSERTDLRLEYSQVRKWTYTHVSDVNAWEYRGQPFGFWLGPDADELFAQLSYYFSPCSIIKFSFSYARKGVGSLYLPHEEEGGDKNPPFPSGVVEKSTGGWLDYRYEISRFVIRGRLGCHQKENRHNQPGDFDNYFAHIVVVYNL
ncbi:MAG: hypothetical protein J7K40_12580 [candidate division Zixibacteria bacterium]|nr:hypothetical protein [candidate division Zixibacteria bacterium]